MDFEGDPLLPLLTAEIEKRTQALMNLTPEEESVLLSLSEDQKKLVSANDKRAKLEYLSKQPNITNASVKAHDKYHEFVNMCAKFSTTDVQA